MDILSNLAELTDERLAEYAGEVRAAFDALVTAENPTAEQVSEAEGLANHIDAIAAEAQRRNDLVADLASRQEALRSRFATTEETPEETPEPEAEVEVVEEEPEPVPAAAEVVPAATAPATTVAAAIARRTTRPPAPAAQRYAPVVITAAADVPEFVTGGRLDGLTHVGQAVINRMRGFGTPRGDGTHEELHKYGVASFALDFPKELTIDRGSDDMEVLVHAMNEHRLPGGSLVAAGGWCAPSETIYDLCAGETTDGMLSVPQINVARGGIRYTRGPDFASVYGSIGWCMTEAQAIAGSVTKTCIKAPCPSFTEVRLDACGLCIKVDILQNAAYPELTQRYTSLALVAHQHQMNLKLIGAIATGSTSVTTTGLGAVSTDTLEALVLQADLIRQKYRLSLSASLETVLPFWVKDVIKIDIARRSAIALEAVSDAQVTAIFAAANVAVQWVYDWQELPDGVVWPDTFDVLMYPAGTWVHGVADVINLSAVYDAAELATNTYTGLFTEQGWLVAQMCFESLKITVPVCTAGRAGALDLTCATTP